jgi:hypothetical protein
MAENDTASNQSILKTILTAAFNKTHSPFTRLIYFLFGKVLHVAVVGSVVASLLVLAIEKFDIVPYFLDEWGKYNTKLFIEEIISLFFSFYIRLYN